VASDARAIVPFGDVNHRRRQAGSLAALCREVMFAYAPLWSPMIDIAVMIVRLLFNNRD
jgi:hypothetical protein